MNDPVTPWENAANAIAESNPKFVWGKIIQQACEKYAAIENAKLSKLVDNMGDICNVHAYSEFLADEQEAVDMLMEGIPAQGGVISHLMLTKLIRAAFRGGVAVTKLRKQKNAVMTK